MMEVLNADELRRSLLSKSSSRLLGRIDRLVFRQDFPQEFQIPHFER